LAYERKDGDIAVFTVKEKKNERGPDWTGTALINGEELQVSFWQKTPTMLAGQIKPKFVSGQQMAKAKESLPPQDDGDEIPF